MIYIAVDTNLNWCKIGCSGNPKLRITNLNTAVPFELELIWVDVGSFIEEKQVQLRFEHLWIKGEWFHYDDSILEYMEKEYAYEVSARRSLSEEIANCKTQQEADELWNKFALRGVEPDEVIDDKEFKSLVMNDVKRIKSRMLDKKQVT